MRRNPRGQSAFEFEARPPDREETPHPTDADAPLATDGTGDRPSPVDEQALTEAMYGPGATHVPSESARDRRARKARGRAAARKIIDLLDDQPRTSFPSTDPIEDAFEEGKGTGPRDGETGH